MSANYHPVTTPLPEPERSRLLAWLNYWEIARRLESANIPEDRIESPVPASETFRPPAPFDGSPSTLKQGEIRLLSSTYLPAETRPLYFAILGNWHGEELIMAPFSSFPVPAVQGEFRVEGLHGQALKVLCVWNARSISRRIMADSWLVETLPDRELDCALDILDWRTTGKELPSEWLDRIGPPIRQENDPRLEYQTRESQLLDYLSEFSAFLEELEEPAELPAARSLEPVSRFRASQPEAFRREIEENASLALAASDQAEYRMVFCSGTLADAVRRFLTGRLPHLEPPGDSRQHAVCLAEPEAGEGGGDSLFAQWRIEGDASSLADRLFALFNYHTGEWIGEGDFSKDGSLATLRRGNPDNIKDAGAEKAALIVFPPV